MCFPESLILLLQSPSHCGFMTCFLPPFSSSVLPHLLLELLSSDTLRHIHVMKASHSSGPDGARLFLCVVTPEQPTPPAPTWAQMQWARRGTKAWQEKGQEQQGRKACPAWSSSSTALWKPHWGNWVRSKTLIATKSQSTMAAV